MPAWSNDLSHCAQLWTFSPLWARRWVFRLSACPNDFSHWAHLCTFSPLWVADASWDEHLRQMTCCIERICAVSPQCELKGVSSDEQTSHKICHIEHICAISLHCELEGVSSDYLLDQKICGLEHICAISLQNETTNACSDRWHMEMTWGTLHKFCCWPSWFLLKFPTYLQQLLTITEDHLTLTGCLLLHLTWWPLSLSISVRSYLYCCIWTFMCNRSHPSVWSTPVMSRYAWLWTKSKGLRAVQSRFKNHLFKIQDVLWLEALASSIFVIINIANPPYSDAWRWRFIAIVMSKNSPSVKVVHWNWYWYWCTSTGTGVRLVMYTYCNIIAPLLILVLSTKYRYW